jgi:hypothetical protein
VSLRLAKDRPAGRGLRHVARRALAAADQAIRNLAPRRGAGRQQSVPTLGEHRDKPLVVKL